MPRLIITVDVSDDVDTKIVDPQDLSGDILEEYNIANRANGVDTQVALAEAKWVEGRRARPCIFKERPTEDPIDQPPEARYCVNHLSWLCSVPESEEV